MALALPGVRAHIALNVLRMPADVEIECAVGTGSVWAVYVGSRARPVSHAFRMGVMGHSSQGADEPGQEHDRGLVVEAAKPEVKQPPLYQVLLLNDDFTPMEFVVEVLQVFFGMNRERATQVMLHVHTRGRGVCGVFTREVAETKVAQVNAFSRQQQHPLLCTLERL